MPKSDSKTNTRGWIIFTILLTAVATGVVTFGNTIATDWWKSLHIFSHDTSNYLKSDADRKERQSVVVPPARVAIAKPETASTKSFFYSNDFKTSFKTGVMPSSVESCIGDANTGTVTIKFTLTNLLPQDFTLGIPFSTNGSPGRAIYQNVRYSILSVTLKDLIRNADEQLKYVDLKANNTIVGAVIFKDIPSNVPEFDQVQLPMSEIRNGYKNLATLTIKHLRIKW